MAEASVKRSKNNLVSDKHWAVYAAAGAASALACQAAEAEIIYVTVNQTLDASQIPASNSSTFLPVGAGGTGQLFFSHSTNNAGSGGAGFFGVLASNGAFAGFNAGGFPYAANLAYCQNVSTQNFLVGTGTMAFNSGYGNSQFLGTGIGYLGFGFDLGAGSQYGWVRVDMMGSPLNAFTIIDYAYCGVGESIGAGKNACATVPEPGTLGLLAAGAVGLLSLRRRRKEIRTA